MIAGARLAVVVAVLCYFVMSALISQTGVTSALMAAHFDREITAIVPLFSFLTGGAFAGVFISLFIFNVLSVRAVFLLCSGLVVLAASGNYLIDHIAAVPVGFSALGVAGGVGMSAAAVTIANTFDVKHRSSMLVGADLFYSAGGYLIVILVAFLASAGARWSAGYLAVGGVSLLIFFLTVVARFPHAHDDLSTVDSESRKEPWNINVYLIGAAMLFYVVGQNAFIVWVPTYLSQTFSVSLEEAGSAVSNYWGAGMVGLIISAFVLQKVRTSRFLLGVTGTGALLTAVLVYSPSESIFTAASALLGLVTIGSMGSMISLGVHQQSKPSMSLVPFLLCCASSGGTISPAASSYIVSVTDIGVSIRIIFFAYLTVFLILAYVTLVRGGAFDSKTLYQQEDS